MKRLFLLGMTLFCVFTLTVGCVKRDSMEDIEIITSSYPIEYLVTELYGEHAEIENIFPDGEEIDGYRFNDKQYNNFSKKDLFIYNRSNSSDIALNLSNRNKNLLLIDSTLGMPHTYGVEDIWLDPSNLLMMSLNIKNGLEEYVSNAILINDINEAYKDLKVSLSELDAEIKLTIENATNPKIIVANKSLKYLAECNKDNHFYLKCDKCGTLIHVDCDCIEELTNHINNDHKFIPNKDHIIINGICNRCGGKK